MSPQHLLRDLQNHNCLPAYVEKNNTVLKSHLIIMGNISGRECVNLIFYRLDVD